MTSDVVLTAALRNNLLSLQNTQRSIDTTQLRLATGRKVNSALDNPQNFFASQALNNRASDLTRLLDGIGQNIQVIRAADNGVTALTTLVEQADSVAQSARDALSQGQAEAKVTGDRDLRGFDDLNDLAGIVGTNTNTLTFTITDENGDPIRLGAFDDATNSAGTSATITIGADYSIEDLINDINDLALDSNPSSDGVAADDIANGDQAFEASLDASGQLEIRTLNGGDFNVVFDAGNSLDSEDLALASELGFGNIARPAGDQAGGPTDTSIEFTAIADVALRSTTLYRDDGAGGAELAVRSTLLSDLVEDDGTTALVAGIDDTADQYLISVNGGTTVAIDLGRDIGGTVEAVTVQDFIDDINDNDTLNQFIRAEFDDATGELSIRPISAEVKSIQIGVRDAATVNLGFGNVDSNDAAGLTSVAGEDFLENIQVGQAAAVLAELEVEFDNIRDQITQLVSNGDTGYRGTNLLIGDDLTTFFNEFRSSSLVTQGVSFTADGLGLNEADFSRESAVDGALADVRAALESVRNFGSTLANDLNIIQTRETFTTNLINTLTEGSDKLVNADQNEEGAKLLALQTRQQLGVTSLSLASQSQQSILRLF